MTTTENVGIEAIETPLKLTPSQPNPATFLITNHGNGDTEVQVDILDLPSTWEWWMVIDGENHSGPISLSVSYDLEHTVEIEIWLLLPMEEAAGERHTIRIGVQPASGNEDSNLLDNIVEFTSITDSVHSPVLKLISGSTSTIAGGIFSAVASLENQGNARDDNLRLKTTVFSTPALLNGKSFLSVGGKMDFQLYSLLNTSLSLTNNDQWKPLSQKNQQTQLWRELPLMYGLTTHRHPHSMKQWF